MLKIGKIVGFHGINGEVKIPFSERLLKNISVSKQLYVFTSKNDYKIMEIEQYRLHKGNILLKFKGYPTRNDVEHLKGAVLKQLKDKLAPLEPEEFFIDDLIGLEVYDTNDILIGKINTVLSNKASSDLIEIKTLNNKIKLVPFVEELVPAVDINKNKIVINNIPGLIEDEI